MWKNTVAEVDTNNDGKISIQEFTDILKKYAVAKSKNWIEWILIF